MSKIELPPLPPDRYARTGDIKDKNWILAAELRARDRQIVELCASLADKLALSRLERAARNNGRDSDFAFGYVNAAEELGAAIRSLLDPAEKETK